jgi:crossover junction endodeoxyribonuclease RuvC
METKCKKETLFVGLDPSINATGVIILDDCENIIEQKTFSVKDKDKLFERSLIKYEEEIDFIAKIINLGSVYIEGPSYQSAGQAILQMGALHFITRVYLYRANVNYKVIAPGTLKKFVTGKGNSKKDLMLLKTYKRWGVEFDDHNVCDAYGLARMALEDFKNDTRSNKKDIK